MKNLIHAVNSFFVTLGLLIYLMPNAMPAGMAGMSSPPDGVNIQERLCFAIGRAGENVIEGIRNANWQGAPWFSVGLVAWLILNMLYWSWVMVKSNSALDRISLEVNGGKVSITIRALEESLARGLRVDPHVRDGKVIVRPSPSKITVTAYLVLIETDNVHSLEGQIIERLRNHFTRIFPAEQEILYEVIINKLKAAPAGSQPDKGFSPYAVPVEQPMYPDKG